MATARRSAAALLLLALGAGAQDEFFELDMEDESNSVAKMRNMFATDTLHLVVGSNTAEWDLRLSPVKDSGETRAMPRGEAFNQPEAHDRLKQLRDRLLFSRGLWFTLDGVRYGDRFFPDLENLKPGTKVEVPAVRDHFLGQYTAYETTWRLANRTAAPNFKFTSTIKNFEAIGTILFEQRFSGLEKGSDLSLPNAMQDLEHASRFTSSAFPRVFVDRVAVGDSMTNLHAGVGVVEFSGPFLSRSKAIPLDELFSRIEFEGGARWAGGPYVFFIPSLDVSFVLSQASNFMVSSCIPGRQNTGGYPGGRKNGKHLMAIECGMMGSVNVDDLPEGTVPTVTYMLVYAPGGINNALKRWGNIMKRKAGMATATKHYDPTITRLGYGTDKGAFYYYHTERGMNYQDLFSALKKSFEESKLPIHYAALDSWWYEKDANGGLVSWEPRDEALPEGFGALRTATKFFFQLHSKWFSPYNLYASNRLVHPSLENRFQEHVPKISAGATGGTGRYPMYIEQPGTGPHGSGGGGIEDFIESDPLKGATVALPMFKEFWRDFLRDAKDRFGMEVYEQDWLWVMQESTNLTLRSFTGAERFFKAMNDGAREAGVAIQFSNALPRHTLQSLLMPQVTQARAADNDYPGTAGTCVFPNCAHYTGTSNMLFAALGLSPSRDSYWTTKKQCCNPLYCRSKDPPAADMEYGCNAEGSAEEPYSELHGVLSSYQTGPYTISDKILHTNASLVHMSIDTNGFLLRPSRPMTAIDRAVWQGLLSTIDLPDGYAVGPIATPDKRGQEHHYPVQSSVSFQTVHAPGGRVSVFNAWIHVLAFGLEHDTTYIWKDLTKAEKAGGARALREEPVMIRWKGHTAEGRGGDVIQDIGLFSPSQPLPLKACQLHDYQLYHLAPLFDEGYALLGENRKWVPISAQRIRMIERIDLPELGKKGLFVVASGAVGEDVELLFMTPQPVGELTDITLWQKTSITYDSMTLGLVVMTCQVR